MTDAELAAIEARLAAAQPHPGGLPANQDARGYSRLAELALCDVPALVAEVRRLQALLGKLGPSHYYPESRSYPPYHAWTDTQQALYAKEESRQAALRAGRVTDEEARVALGMEP